MMGHGLCLYDQYIDFGGLHSRQTWRRENEYASDGMLDFLLAVAAVERWQI